MLSAGVLGETAPAVAGRRRALSLRAGGPATLSLGRLAELRRVPGAGGLRIAGGLDRG